MVVFQLMEPPLEFGCLTAYHTKTRDFFAHPVQYR